MRNLICSTGMGARNNAGSVGFACGRCATMLGVEHLAGGAGLLQFLLKSFEGVSECLRLSLLIFELLGEPLWPAVACSGCARGRLGRDHPALLPAR
jgi:hypothetical protein